MITFEICKRFVGCYTFHRARHPYEISHFSETNLAQAKALKACADAVYVGEVTDAVQCHLLSLVVVQVQLLVELGLPPLRVSVAAWDFP